MCYLKPFVCELQITKLLFGGAPTQQEEYPTRIRIRMAAAKYGDDFIFEDDFGDFSDFEDDKEADLEEECVDNVEELDDVRDVDIAENESSETYCLCNKPPTIPSTGDQCSQLIVATLVPSTPICLFFNLAKLQCKQTVVTYFCRGFVNKIHIIGKGMIKEHGLQKSKKSEVGQKN